MAQDQGQDQGDQSVDNVPDARIEPAGPDVTSDQQNVAEGADAQQEGATSEPDAAGRLGPNYVIGPEDVITVSVFDVPELSKVTVRVDNDGRITLPLVGPLKAAGLTSEQLREELEETFGDKYLQDPQITLFIDSFNSRPVSVVGAVEKPGLYHLTGRRTLVEVLAMAGGLGKKGSGAAGKMVYVDRRGGFGKLQLVPGMNMTAQNRLAIDLRKLIYDQDEALNIEVHPFDVVAVSKAGVVYVIGAVQKPGGFVLEDKESVTVLEALAMAQGFAPDPARSHAKIIRRSENGAVTEVPIDLGKVLSGKSADTMLAANDVLFVPNSPGRAVTKRTTESAVGVLTGLLIYGRL